MNRECIAAIATPAGKGAIGIVRISGIGAGELLSAIFSPYKPPGEWASHRLCHGKIMDGGRVIDEVLCCVMRAPRTYTREETAEIYTHGGAASLRAVLKTVLHNGARLAEPGEFTRRAFLNGRIDLTQAEAVMDVINAKTDFARAAGIRQLGGGLLSVIERFRETLLKWLAHIELSIDYPEHEEEAMNLKTIRSESNDLLAEMETLRQTASVGRVLTEGVRTVITGRPNVGKSSLLNAVLNEDRAIVTELPGTTRDVLSEPVTIGGVPLLLSDTAGIRETEDIIEKFGVDKSIAQTEQAQLILFVADHSEPPRREDFWILEKIKNKNVIILLNKSDLAKSESWDNLSDFPIIIEISAKNRTGLNVLYQTIAKMFLEGWNTDGNEQDMLTRERHCLLLEQAITNLKNAMTAIDNGLTEDLVSFDLTAAYQALGQIIGKEAHEDIIDRIFEEFCVGK